MPAKRVLVIDDDALLSDGVKILLESQGYTVDTAASGKAGFAQAQADKPDLILLDVMMTTKTEGFEVARAFKNDPQLASVPVVMVTGIRNEMDLPYSFQPDGDWLPVKRVLEKPIKPDVLIQAVVDIIGA